MGDEIYSNVHDSNRYTMEICAKHDARQKIGEPYTIPDEATRLLRAKLILEEAVETINALGCLVEEQYVGWKKHIVVVLNPDHREICLNDIIDGCCDLNYVLTGTLVSCGVPDLPHYEEVSDANERKLPNGKATFNSDGKFMKPQGWKAPDHDKVRQEVMAEIGVQP